MQHDPQQLQRALDAADDDEARIDTLLEEANRLRNTSAAISLELAGRALRMARALKDKARAGQAHMQEGFALHRLGDLTGALGRFRLALRGSPHIDAVTTARALMGVGIIYTETSRYVEASEILSRALEAAIDARHTHTHALVHNSISILHKTICDYPRAIEELYRARKLFEEIENAEGISWVMNNIGAIHLSMGEHARAATIFHDLLESAQRRGDDYNEALAWTNLAESHVGGAAYEESLGPYARALELFRRFGSRIYAAYCLTQMGRAEMELGRYGDALEHLQEARSLAEETGDQNIWLIRGNIGLLRFRSGERDEGIAMMLEAIEGLHEIEDRNMEREMHKQLSACLEQTGDAAGALRHFKIAAMLAEQLTGAERRRQVHELEAREAIERAERDRRAAAQQKEKLEEEMQARMAELASVSLHLMEREQLLASLRQDLEEIARRVPSSERSAMRAVMRRVDGSLGSEEGWQAFEEQFEKMQYDFIGRLATSYPSLTRTELKICSLLKLNLATKEIADLLVSSERTIRNHRYRIRQKLNLPEESSLSAYVAGF